MKEMTIIAGINADDMLWKLNMQIKITVCMKVMVTINILTNANITNGMRGIITDIILDLGSFKMSLKW